MHAAVIKQVSLTCMHRDDRDQCQTAIDKVISFAKEHGSRRQYKKALQVLLPGGPIYDYLEGRIQPASLTYIRLAEITETEEKDRINKDIGERRTRLGAKIGQVTSEVKCEVFAASELDGLYQNIIDWTQDDEVRHEYEQKLFERALEHLSALPMEAKGQKRDEVMKMAGDMVIVKHPLESAWTLHLEWKDIESVSDLDTGVLKEYITLFPKNGLSKILRAHFGEEHDHEAEPKVNGHANGDALEDNKAAKRLSSEDRLILLAEGLDESKDSAFGHRIVSDFYRGLEEYESCVDVSRTGLVLLHQASAKSGLHFQRNQDALNSNLATSLVFYQAPKNHPEAKAIFDEILGRRPTATAALLGLGLILEEQEDYKKASEFLEQASKRDPDNIQISAEAAWCRALVGDFAGGLESLKASLEALGRSEARELRALIHYRIGRCLWELKPDKPSRKDRSGAYASFIASLKTNPSLPSTYTSLGLYYAEYSRDRKRARQCFQKAFELSAAEIQAAERLARAFADDRDWDIVEVIAQRVIDSGVAKPAPGSKKKGSSWPFSALGTVQMTKQDYPKAVISFQAALRIAPLDYYSWVGLGESYHSSGRYIAAQKALDHAKSLASDARKDVADDAWFAEYMLANVHRELGDFDEAVEGYKNVREERPQELGLSLALLQTLVQRAYHSVETGFFGLAADSAKSAIEAAAGLVKVHPQVFNIWKAIGDAIAVFSLVPEKLDCLPTDIMRSFLLDSELAQDEQVQQIDSVTSDDLKSVFEGADGNVSSLQEASLHSAISAYKQAIIAASSNIHAQAVAWYNLGWMELKADQTIKQIHQPRLKRTTFARASVRCFKRAIELEAGNADFWNALGVSTTSVNPAVAQHSFVRSLHLNERSARTWTNLGTLYLMQGDQDLAHTAFARAQSTDPDYAYAWVGEGMIAAQVGDLNEALSHFLHAADISDNSSSLVKSKYSFSTFDHIAGSMHASTDLASLVQPIFILQQLVVQEPLTVAYKHLLALLQERVGDYDSAIKSLTDVSASAEARFEENEEVQQLGQFAKAKADLARCCLASGDYATAIEHAETALDLTSETDSGDLDEAQRQKLRLSAHTSAGLAHCLLDALDESLSVLEEARSESDSAPDIVCLLAEVLWKKGDSKSRDAARSHLFDSIEKHPGHPRSTSLIGAMAALAEDKETLEAVTEDLANLRTSEKLQSNQKRQIERLIASIAVLLDHDSKAIDEAKVSVMLAPNGTAGWSALAEAGNDDEEPNEYAVEMAALTAMQTVPPHGHTTADELSAAVTATGLSRDAQRAVALTPWLAASWDSLSQEYT